MHDASPKSKSHLKLIRNLVALFVILWLVGAHWYIDIYLYSRTSYQQVIEDARARTAVSNETVFFTGDWLFDPTAPPEATNICARRIGEDALFVRILTYDAQQAGKFGYVYAETSFDNDEELELQLDRIGCGQWSVSKSLLGNWWVIEGL